MPHPDQRSAGALHGRPKAPPIANEGTPSSTRHGFPLDPSSGLPSFDEPDEHVATEIGVGAPASVAGEDDATDRSTPVMPIRERIVFDMPELVWNARGALDLALDPHRDAMLPDAPLTFGAVLSASLAL
jgi:hypothetical protein